MKNIFGTAIILLASCGNRTGPEVQYFTINQTIACMDTVGTPFRYKLKYNSIELSDSEIGMVKSIIKSIVRAKVGTFHFIEDCLMAKDSIENIIINEILENENTAFAGINSITLEIEIPYKIKEHLLTRYIEAKDIKSY